MPKRVVIGCEVNGNRPDFRRRLGLLEAHDVYGRRCSIVRGKRRAAQDAIRACHIGYNHVLDADELSIGWLGVCF